MLFAILLAMTTRRFSLLAASLWGICIILIQVWKYTHFGYNALDLAIYTQALWSLAHGQGFASAIQGGSYLADHFEPVLFLIAPLHRLFSSPLTLLITQTICLSVAVYQLLHIAQERLSGRWRIVGILLILLNPFLWNIATYEFHGLTLAVPLIIGAILAYERRHYRRWIVLLLLLTFWREDLPLLVAGWAILSRVDRRTKGWVIAPIIIAIIGLAVDHTLISKAGASHYKFLIFYQALGSTWFEVLTSPFRHPVIFFVTIFHPNNWGTAAGILGSVGGLCLLRPRWFIPLSLVGVQMLLLHADPRSMLRLHYLATVLPFVLIAALRGLEDVPTRLAALVQRWKAIPPELYIVTSGSIFALTIAITGPLAWITQRAQLPTPTVALHEAVALVRPDESVIASFGPLAHLASRRDAYSLHYLFLGSKQYSKVDYPIPATPEVIVLDRRQWFEYMSLYRKTDKDGVSGYDRFSQLLASKPYSIIYDRDDVVVWRINGGGKRATLTPKPTQKISLPAINGTLSLRPRKDDPASIEATLNWTTARAGTVPVTLRWRWYRDSHLITEKILVLNRSEIPVVIVAKGEQGVMRSTTTFPTSALPNRLVVDELTFSGEYLLQSWQTFHPVLKNITILGSATLQLQ